jgi:hypothetical protein
VVTDNSCILTLWHFEPLRFAALAHRLRVKNRRFTQRYHMHKEAGRHAFVTKSLQEGKSLKWVMDAGRWLTLKIPAEKYGNLEKQEAKWIARHAKQARNGSERYLANRSKLREANSIFWG